MTLWLVTAIQNQGYDCFDGFVIRAETADHARELAQARIADEWGAAVDFWLNPAFSRCAPLEADGDVGIILDSFNAG